MAIAFLLILAAFLVLAYRCITYGYGQVVLWCAVVGLGLPAVLALDDVAHPLAAPVAVAWSALIVGLPVYWLARSVVRQRRVRR